MVVFLIHAILLEEAIDIVNDVAFPHNLAKRWSCQLLGHALFFWLCINRACALKCCQWRILVQEFPVLDPHVAATHRWFATEGFRRENLPAGEFGGHTA